MPTFIKHFKRVVKSNHASSPDFFVKVSVSVLTDAYQRTKVPCPFHLVGWIFARN